VKSRALPRDNKATKTLLDNTTDSKHICYDIASIASDLGLLDSFHWSKIALLGLLASDRLLEFPTRLKDVPTIMSVAASGCPNSHPFQLSQLRHLHGIIIAAWHGRHFGRCFAFPASLDALAISQSRRAQCLLHNTFIDLIPLQRRVTYNKPVPNKASSPSSTIFRVSLTLRSRQLVASSLSP
jgi:hypothetical protein